MENYRYNEGFFSRNRVLVSYIAGYIVGTAIQAIPHAVHTDQENAEEAQAYNHELTSQIQKDTSDDPSKIVVHTTDKTVTFRLPEGRNCESDYKVTDDVAHLAGNITCQTVIK